MSRILIFVYVFKMNIARFHSDALTAYDNHSSHISIDVVTFAKANDFHLLTIPPH